MMPTPQRRKRLGGLLLIAMWIGSCWVSAGPSDTQAGPVISLRELRERAEKGDAKAQVNLGIQYAKGSGVEVDHQKACEWYRKAAEQGNRAAQYNLGLAAAQGEGVPQDYAEALI